MRIKLFLPIITLIIVSSTSVIVADKPKEVQAFVPSGEVYFWVEGEKLDKSIGNSQQTSGGQFLAVIPSSKISRKIILPQRNQYHVWLRYFDMVGSLSRVVINETQHSLEGTGKGWHWKQLGVFENTRADLEIVNEKGICYIDTFLFTTNSSYRPPEKVPDWGKFDFRQATSNYPSVAIVYAHKMERGNYPYELSLGNLKGWNVSLYEDFRLTQLVQNLDNYHIVFFDAGVNLLHLKTYEKEFTSFVNKGGSLFITEISDEKEAGLVSLITGSPINVGKTDRIYPGRIIQGPLTIFPNDLRKIEFMESPPILYSLRKYSDNLCYFRNVDKDYKICFFSKENIPLVISKDLDKGTVLLTPLFSGLGPIREFLENLWGYRCTRQFGVYSKDFLIHMQSYDCQVELKIVNESSIDRSFKLLFELDREKWFEKRERVKGEEEEKVILKLDNILLGNHSFSWYLFDEESGRLCYTDSGDVYIQPLIQVQLDHLVYNNNESELNFTVQTNFILTEMENLKYSIRIDDKEIGESPLELEKLGQKGSLNIKDLSTGEHTLQVALAHGEDILANSRVNFQKVDITEPVHKVMIEGENIKIDGESIFLFGFYGVNKESLKILKENGFNFVTGGIDYEYLQEAYRQGIKVMGWLYPFPEDDFARRASSTRLYPALVFRTIYEEPIAVFECTKQFLQEKNKVAKKYDPIHPTVLLLPPGECVPQYVEIPDIIMIDDYPVQAKDGSLDSIGSSIENCRQTIIKSCGYAKPILMCLQTHSWPPGRLIVPSPAQERAMAYLSIVHQAKGIVYFIFEEAPPEANLSAIHYSDGHFQEPLWTELKKLTSEIRKTNMRRRRKGDPSGITGRDGECEWRPSVL